MKANMLPFLQLMKAETPLDSLRRERPELSMREADLASFMNSILILGCDVMVLVSN